MTDRGLRKAYRLGQVAPARLGVRARGDEAEEAEAGWIRQRLEGLGEHFGLLLVERGREQWRAAVLEGLDQLHDLIISTSVDVSATISTAVDGWEVSSMGPCCPDCC
jgi:hypothetical protein